MKKVILQPIGNKKSIDDFKENNSTRWAEKEIYKKLWKESEGAIVLFTHKGKIFAKATISIPKTDTEESNHSTYPLKYDYYDIKFIDIAFSKIKEIANISSPYRNYTVLNEEQSQDILDYLESLESKIYPNDEEYQNSIDKAKTLDIKDEAETPKERKEYKGKKYYPRNRNRAKLALDRANYQCEIDSNHTTFISNTSKENYVEAHHLIPFKVQKDIDYSVDVTHNIVSLCPICHRKIHLASFNDKKEILKFLYDKHEKGLKEVRLDIQLEDLYEMYRIDNNFLLNDE